MKIFLTSFCQIGLISINTLFIANKLFLGTFIVSFMISMLWCYNVGKISVSTINQKLTYALGAGCGSITGLFILKLIL